MLRTVLGSRHTIAKTLHSTGSQIHLAARKMSQSNILIYVLRRDLRLEDNPVFHEIASSSHHGFTHLLPVYAFAAQQIEFSGFIPSSSPAKSPYPEARSPVGGFWRCGPHRAKFLAESVADLKESLRGVGSDLEIRVGMVGEVVSKLIDGFNESDESTVGAVWMTSEEGVEERREEKDVKRTCAENGVDFRLFGDEKYFIDELVGLVSLPTTKLTSCKSRYTIPVSKRPS